MQFHVQLFPFISPSLIYPYHSPSFSLSFYIRIILPLFLSLSKSFSFFFSFIFFLILSFSPSPSLSFSSYLIFLFLFLHPLSTYVSSSACLYDWFFILRFLRGAHLSYLLFPPFLVAFPQGEGTEKRSKRAASA